MRPSSGVSARPDTKHDPRRQKESCRAASVDPRLEGTRSEFFLQGSAKNRQTNKSFLMEHDKALFVMFVRRVNLNERADH